MLVSVPVQAQILYGSIIGVVKDAQGGAVPGATVTVVNKETNLTRDAVTDAEGRYIVTNVLAGPYDVKVSLQGFKEAVRTDVPVTIGQIARVDVTLEVGSVSESITVASDTQLLQTDKADVHTELKSAEITSMPLNRFRNYQALMNLVPGTTPMAFGNAETDTPARSLATNVNGQVNTNNTTRTDGATNMNIWLPNHNMYISPAETVDTVNVSTSSFDAEQGNAGGAAVTVVTKSGTNQFRGSAFEFYDSDKLNATPKYFSAGRRPEEAPGHRQYLWRHDRRPDQEGQGVLLRIARGIQARSEPVHLLQRAGRQAARRRLQPGAQRRRHAPADLRSHHGDGQRRRSHAVRQQPDSDEPAQPDRPEGPEPLSAAEQPRHRRRRVDEQLQAPGRPHVRPRQLGRQGQLEPHVGASDLGQVQLHERDGRRPDQLPRTRSERVR